MDNITAKQQLSSTPSVIDTLSAGFDSINRIIWVALIPLALDLFLWKGPQLSIAPFMRQVLTWYSNVVVAQLDQGVGASMTVDAVQSMEQLRQGLQSAATDFNIMGVLAGNGPLVGMLPGVPSLAIFQATGPVTEIGGPLLIFGLVVVLALLSVFLGCFYLAIVAQQVRDGRIDVLRLAKSVVRYWLNAIGFLALVLGLALILGVPTMLLIGVAFVISPGIGLILSGLAMIGVQLCIILMILYFFFIGDAIVVSEAGPFRALRYSVQVVARNFWSALALIVLMFIISFGTQEIWRYISNEPWGAFAGIIGNAYIVSGLTAGRMLFYRNRLASMQESRVLASGMGNG